MVFRDSSYDPANHIPHGETDEDSDDDDGVARGARSGEDGASDEDDYDDRSDDSTPSGLAALPRRHLRGRPYRFYAEEDEEEQDEVIQEEDVMEEDEEEVVGAASGSEGDGALAHPIRMSRLAGANRIPRPPASARPTWQGLFPRFGA